MALARSSGAARLATASCLLLALCLAAGTVAAHATTPLTLPRGWQRVSGDVRGDETLRVTLAVRQRNREALERTFREVSDPDHPRYGKFLSLSQLAALTAPKATHVVAAQSWLASLGAQYVETTVQGDFVAGHVTVAALRAAFPSARFARCRHARTGTTVVRATTRLALPSTVEAAVDVARGLWDVPLMADHIRPAVASPTPQQQQQQQQQQPADPDSPLTAAFVTTGNQRLTLLVSVMCPDFDCTAGAGFDTLTAIATPINASGSQSGKPLTAQYKVATPLCTNNGESYSCPLTINDAQNYVTYIMTVNGTSTAGKQATAMFGPPVAARPWTDPNLVHARYNVPQSELAAEKKGQSGVVLWAGQYYSPDDLKLFLQDTGQPAATPILETPWANATNNASMPGGEGQMDIELITSTATGVQSTFWYSSNNIYNGFLDFQMQIANVADPPLVWSCSWGTPESDMGPDGTAFEQRVSFELQKMGARGMTMVFASGDAGVTGAGRGGNCNTFQPSFPASSPYVLSVSGTVLAPAASAASAKAAAPQPSSTAPPMCGMDMQGAPIECNGADALAGVQEILAMCCSDGTIWTAAGGFSDNFTRPSWQDGAVTSYLAEASASLPPSSMWNASNRGYPDVAALSDQVLIYRDGGFESSGGTSAASPITAGLLALVNDARLRSGRPPLGFVAPWLYKVAASTPAAFNDVVVGNNKNGELQECPYGFSAAKGWDPVTGWGSMNIDVIIKLATGQPL